MTSAQCKRLLATKLADRWVKVAEKFEPPLAQTEVLRITAPTNWRRRAKYRANDTRVPKGSWVRQFHCTQKGLEVEAYTSPDDTHLLGVIVRVREQPAPVVPCVFEVLGKTTDLGGDYVWEVVVCGEAYWEQHHELPDAEPDYDAANTAMDAFADAYMLMENVYAFPGSILKGDLIRKITLHGHKREPALRKECN